MTQPSVTITELDGALGILPLSAGKLYSVVGASSQGPTDTPSTFARVTDLVASFGAGPMVEAAAYFIKFYGRPVVVTRTATSVAASVGDLDVTEVGGTSTVTLNGSADANDDYEAYVKVITGGTVGTAGITYQWSLDGGRTLSPVTDLGTANSITLPGSGGIVFDLGAGDLDADDVFTAVSTAPRANATELTAAHAALASSLANWGLSYAALELDAATFDAVEAEIVGMAASGKYRAWVGNTRMPDVGETEAAYLTAMSSAFGAKSSKHGALCAGAAKITSGVSGRKYRRPIAFAVAALQASAEEHINIADVNLGALPGVDIRDANGNPDEHDESLNPGLDDARFLTLRTWGEPEGVYVNRPRLFSPTGSDFEIVPHRLVANLGHAALRKYFTRRLNKDVIVDSTTGFLLPEERQEIERGAIAALTAAVLGTPKASGVQVSVSQTDNILSTKTITGQARIIPLAYPEAIVFDFGFLNPALQVQSAA
jgi:hypothetical protein